MNRHPTRARSVLLTVHVLAIAGLLGSELAVLGLGIAGLSDIRPEEVYPAASLIAHRITLPAAAATLLSGIALSVTTVWRLDRFGWVQAKLVITLALTGLLLAVLLPRISSAAGDATSNGAVSDATQRQLVIAPALAAATMLLNTVLGVVKPRRRARSTMPRKLEDTRALNDGRPDRTSGVA
jgi:hypothetical protein